MTCAYRTMNALPVIFHCQFKPYLCLCTGKQNIVAKQSQKKSLYFACSTDCIKFNYLQHGARTQSGPIVLSCLLALMCVSDIFWSTWKWSLKFFCSGRLGNGKLHLDCATCSGLRSATGNCSNTFLHGFSTCSLGANCKTALDIDFRWI